MLRTMLQRSLIYASLMSKKQYSRRGHKFLGVISASHAAMGVSVCMPSPHIQIGWCWHDVFTNGIRCSIEAYSSGACSSGACSTA